MSASSRPIRATGTSPAADLILQEAGGRLTDLDGDALTYNRPEPIHGELAAASSRLHPRVIEAMTATSTFRAGTGPSRPYNRSEERP